MTTDEYDFQLPTNDPYRRGLMAPLWLTLLALLGTLVAWGVSALGLTSYVFLVIAVGFLVLFGVITLIAWVWGQTQIRRGAEFLASDRPLVRWAYSTLEWERLKEATWEEEGGDWKVQLGCLTVLFAITGVLTGVLIGADEGFGQALLGQAGGDQRPERLPVKRVGHPMLLPGCQRGLSQPFGLIQPTGAEGILRLA